MDEELVEAVAGAIREASGGPGPLMVHKLPLDFSAYIARAVIPIVQEHDAKVAEGYISYVPGSHAANEECRAIAAAIRGKA